MKTETDVLDELRAVLNDVSDETVARVLQTLGKKRGMPIVAYSSRDVNDVLLDIAEDNPQVMMSKFPKIVDDVLHSETWEHVAEHAQEVLEQELYGAVMESVRKFG
jgi:hypothetical protein